MILEIGWIYQIDETKGTHRNDKQLTSQVKDQQDADYHHSKIKDLNKSPTQWNPPKRYRKNFATKKIRAKVEKSLFTHHHKPNANFL